MSVGQKYKLFTPLKMLDYSLPTYNDNATDFTRLYVVIVVLFMRHT